MQSDFQGLTHLPVLPEFFSVRQCFFFWPFVTLFRTLSKWLTRCKWCGSKLSVHLKVDVVWKADREISGFEQKENKWENCEQNNNKEVRREIMGPPKMRFLDTKYYQRREKILSRPKIEPTFCTTVLSIMEIGRKLPKDWKWRKKADLPMTTATTV